MHGDVVCADTGDADDEGDQYLEEACEHESLLGFVYALGGKTLLYNVLVEAPVAEVGDPDGAHYGRDTGHVGERAGIMALLHNEVQMRVVEVVARREVGEDIADTGHNTLSAADRAEREHRGDKTAADKEHYLEHVSPRHGRKASVDRVDSGDDIQRKDYHHPERYGETAELEHGTLESEYLLYGEGSEPCHGSKVHEHIEEEPENGECKTHSVVVAFLEELGNGEDLLLEHQRQQELADHDKGHGSHKLVCSSGYAVGITGTGHSDKLLGRDVRRNQRGADRPPCQGVSGKEVVIGAFLRSFLGTAQEKAQRDQDHEIDQHDDKVDRLESRSRDLLENVHLSYV